MTIKNVTLIKRIGLVLSIIGLIFMLVNDRWENNPISYIMEKYLFISAIGLLMWGWGNQKKIDLEKEENK